MCSLTAKPCVVAKVLCVGVAVIVLHCCRLLYDVLTHPPIADASPSILIACNKQDVPGAVSPAAISKRLEDEL